MQQQQTANAFDSNEHDNQDFERLIRNIDLQAENTSLARCIDTLNQTKEAVKAELSALTKEFIRFKEYTRRNMNTMQAHIDHNTKLGQTHFVAPQQQSQTQAPAEELTTQTSKSTPAEASTEPNHTCHTSLNLHRAPTFDCFQHAAISTQEDEIQFTGHIEPIRFDTRIFDDSNHDFTQGQYKTLLCDRDLADTLKNYW